MAKAFAYQGDMSEKTITFDEIGDGYCQIKLT